jgi:hypothetical protein
VEDFDVSRSEKRAQLTQQVLTGVSLGVLTVATLGCTPVPSGSESALPPEQLCQRVLESQDSRLAEELLRNYPTERCTVSTLAALPRESLREISPAVLARVPDFVLSQLPPDARSALRIRLEDGSEGADAGPDGGY